MKWARMNGTEIEFNPYMTTPAIQGKRDVIAKLSSQSPSGMSDADVKCYKDRYLDVA